MLKRNWKIILFFITSIYVWSLIIRSTNPFCSAIGHYFGSDDFFNLIKEVSIVLIVFFGSIYFGKKLFQKVSLKYNKNNNKIFIYIYTFIIATIALSPLISRIPNNIANYEIYSSLCDKSSGDWFDYYFHNLNLNEYNFIKSKSSWRLPSLDSTSIKINTYLSYEDFIPDYELRITCYTQSEKIDTSQWEILSDSLSFKLIQFRAIKM